MVKKQASAISAQFTSAQRKVISLFVGVAFCLTQVFIFPSPKSYAQVSFLARGGAGSPTRHTLASAKLQEIVVPPELAFIQDQYQGDSGRFVVLIQDAHAIPAAQESIQKLIGHFQTTYGVNLVALEGAAARLDAQIFRSFPEEELLKGVLQPYQERGELTGPNAAALFHE